MSPAIENLNSTLKTLGVSHQNTVKHFIQSASNERKLVFMLGDIELPNFFKAHYPAVGLVLSQCVIKCDFLLN
jgi:hypothetical protein